MNRFHNGTLTDTTMITKTSGLWLFITYGFAFISKSTDLRQRGTGFLIRLNVNTSLEEFLQCCDFTTKPSKLHS